MLIATLKFLAKYPCPRCLIEKQHIYELGNSRDDSRRAKLRVDNHPRQYTLEKARDQIFKYGRAPEGTVIKEIMNHSQVPVRVSSVNNVLGLALIIISRMPSQSCKKRTRHLTSTRCLFQTYSTSSRLGCGLQCSDMYFKFCTLSLGICCSKWIHGMSIVFPKAKTNIASRYRKISTFGRLTIRRFPKRVTALKGLAARDLEDLLQV